MVAPPSGRKTNNTELKHVATWRSQCSRPGLCECNPFQILFQHDAREATSRGDEEDSEGRQEPPRSQEPPPRRGQWVGVVVGDQVVGRSGTEGEDEEMEGGLEEGMEEAEVGEVGGV